MRLIWVVLITSVLVIIVFLAFGNIEATFGEILDDLKGDRSGYALASFLILASDIVLPVPSSVVMYLNGSVLGLGVGAGLSFISVLLSVVVGYYLGRFTSLGLRASQDPKTQKVVERFGGLAIVITRPIPILAESVAIAAGYANQSLGKFILFNAIGYIPVCLIYAYFGNLGGNQDLFYTSFGAAIALAGVTYFAGRKWLVKSS